MHCVRNRSYLPLAVARQQAFAEILELSHLLMLEAVSACVTRRRSSSRARLPGGSLSAASLNLTASFESLSSKVSVCLTRLRCLSIWMAEPWPLSILVAFNFTVCAVADRRHQKQPPPIKRWGVAADRRPKFVHENSCPALFACSLCQCAGQTGRRKQRKPERRVDHALAPIRSAHDSLQQPDSPVSFLSPWRSFVATGSLVGSVRRARGYWLPLVPGSRLGIRSGTRRWRTIWRK